MTIETGWNTISATQIIATAPIQAEDGEGRHLLSNLNTLDEGLADRACPGSSGQAYYGHDHALEGGGPLIRGMAFCADGGMTPILTFDFISGAPKSEALGYSHASPGLNPDGRQFYRCDIKYKAQNSKHRITLNSGDEVVLEDFPDSEVPRWATIYGAIPNNDWLTLANSLTCWPETNYSTAQLDIYCLIIWETYENSQYHAGVVDIPEVVGNYTTYSWPNAKLAKELVESGDSLDSLTLANAMMRTTALYEHTLDRPAMGASTQRLQGHDHNPSGYGGRPIPMGCIYRCRTWKTASPLWSKTLTTQNTWYYFDEDASAGARRTTASSTPGGTTTTHPMVLAPVSHGFNSSGNPPTTAPYLIGVVELRHAAAPSAIIEVRWYHVGTGEHSAVATGAAGSDETLVCLKVPCVGGVTNRFAIEVRCTSDSGVLVEMMGAALFEVGSFNGTDATYIASTGTGPVTVANEFRRV